MQIFFDSNPDVARIVIVIVCIMAIVWKYLHRCIEINVTVTGRLVWSFIFGWFQDVVDRVTEIVILINFMLFAILMFR